MSDDEAIEIKAFYFRGNYDVMLKQDLQSHSSIPKNIRYLDIDLFEVPESLCFEEYQELTHLRLRNIPKKFNLNCLRSLPRLTVLQLEENHRSFNDVSIALTKLKHIEKLYLESCRIKDLPSEFANLKRSLKVLSLSRNPFSKGIPSVLGELHSLEQLSLESCQLKTKSENWSCLRVNQKLQVLHLKDNDFSEGLPEVVFELSSLRQLDLERCKIKSISDRLAEIATLENLNISHNKNLERLPKTIFKLRHLHELNYEGCALLEFPPFAIYTQGLSAIKTYLEDLFTHGEAEITDVSVALLGPSESQKNTLIQLLWPNSTPTTPHPGCFYTRCSKDEKLNTVFTYVNFGKLELHHVAYRSTIKEHFIPVVVIDVDLFKERQAKKLSITSITKDLCFDWLYPLYSVCPRLGKPFLVLISSKDVANEESEKIRGSLNEETEYLMKSTFAVHSNESEQHKFFELRQLLKGCIFNKEDTLLIKNFVSTSPLLDYQSFKDRIHVRSKEYKTVMPCSWEKVRADICDQTEAYRDLSGLKSQFTEVKEWDVVLKYLAGTGKIVWFSTEEFLRNWVFGNIPQITKVFNALFKSDGDTYWKTKVEDICNDFKKCPNTYVDIDKQIREHLDSNPTAKSICRFHREGKLDETLLKELIKWENLEMRYDLVQALIIAFSLAVWSQADKCFIFPLFTTDYLELEPFSEEKMQFRFDISSKFQMPHYLANLIVSRVLGSLGQKKSKIARNGLRVDLEEDIFIQVINDRHQRLMIQVFSPIRRISKAWDHLIKVATCIVEIVVCSCRGVRPTFSFYCTSCLWLGKEYPEIIKEPEWFSYKRSMQSEYPLFCKFSKKHDTLKKGICRCTEKRLTAAIDPRFELEDKDLEGLEEFFSSQTKRRDCQPVKKEENIKKLEIPTSDTEWKKYVGLKGTNAPVELKMDVEPCTDESIIKLYHRSDLVYSMTSMKNGIRGRALILNHTVYGGGANRKGADYDYPNLKRLFQKMALEVSEEYGDKDADYRTNLSEKEMFETLEEETSLEVHKHYSMFVLVIMCHGLEDNKIILPSREVVPLRKLCDKINGNNFKYMKGKPKLVIVQACSGGEPDLGDTKSFDGKNDDRTSGYQTKSDSGSPPPSPDADKETSPTITLGGSDFFIIKPSQEGKLARRLETHGALMIRVLIVTFYKYACHFDLETLFKEVSYRVEKASKELMEHEGKKWTGGNIPSYNCSPQDKKKVYLFPKFPSLDYRSGG